MENQKSYKLKAEEMDDTYRMLIGKEHKFREK